MSIAKQLGSLFERVSKPDLDMLAHSSQNDPPEPSFSTSNASGLKVTVVFVGLVRAFDRSSLFVEGFPLFRFSRDRSKDSEIPHGFSVDDSTVIRRRAEFGEGASREMGCFLKGDKRATKLETASVFAEAPICHSEIVETDRDSIFIDFNWRGVSKVTLVGFI